MNTKLLERLEDRLKEFISTEEVPYGGGLMGDGYDKPQYPSLHLSRSTDAGLMKLPGEGSAMVRYRVKSRNIDESRDDGQPLYGASIEIQSLEPVSEGAELEETVFLKEFAEARDRDGEGRFAAGGIPGPRDYALAQAMAKKKKAAVGAGVGVGALAGGAALMRSNRGRQVFEGLRNRLVR